MRKKSRRGLALLLVFCLMMTMIPASVFGAENGGGGMSGGSGPGSRPLTLEEQYERNDAELQAMIGRINALRAQLNTGDNTSLKILDVAASHIGTMYKELFVDYSYTIKKVSIFGDVVFGFPNGMMNESEKMLNLFQFPTQTIESKIAAQDMLLYMGETIESGMALGVLAAGEEFDPNNLPQVETIKAFLEFDYEILSKKIGIVKGAMNNDKVAKIISSRDVFELYIALPQGAFLALSEVKKELLGEDSNIDDLIAAYSFISDAVTGKLFDKYEDIDFTNVNEGTIAAIDNLIADLDDAQKTLTVTDSMAANIANLLKLEATDTISLMVAILGADGEWSLGDFIDDLLASQAPEFAGLGIGKLVNGIFGEAAAKDLNSAQVHKLIDDAIAALEDLKVEIQGDDTDKGIDLNAAKKLAEDIISGEVTKKYERLTFNDINDIPNLNKLMGYVKADLDGCTAILKSANVLDKQLGSILGNQRVSDVVLQYISQTLPGLIDDLLKDQHSALGQLGIGDFITKELLKPAGMLSLERAVKHLEDVADIVGDLCKATQKLEDTYLYIKNIDEAQAKAWAEAQLELLKKEIKDAAANSGDIQKIKREIKRVVKDAEDIYNTVKETIDQIKALEECLKEVLTEENAKALVKALWDHYEDQIIAAIKDCVNGSDLGDAIAKIKETAKEIKDIYLCVKDAIDQVKALEECLKEVLTEENAKALAKALWDRYEDQIIAAIKDCINGSDLGDAIAKIKETAKEIKDIYLCVKDTVDKLEKLKKWAEANLPDYMQQWADQACQELKDQLIQAIKNSSIPELVKEVKEIAKDVEDIYELAVNPDALKITAVNIGSGDVFYTFSTNYDHIWNKYSGTLQKLNIKPEFKVNFDDVNVPETIFTIKSENQLVLKESEALQGDYQVKVSFRLSTSHAGKLVYTTLGTTTVEVKEVTQPPIDTKYKVRFSVEGGNGALVAAVTGAAISSGDNVLEGKTVEFTATPDSGYEVKEWKVNGAAVPGTSATYTVTNLNEDTTVTVEFKTATQPPIDTKYEVKFSVDGGNGTLTAAVAGAAISSGDNVLEGKTVEFTATPDSGYEVKAWKVNGAVVPGTSATYTVTNLNEDTTVTVEFEPEIQTVKHQVKFSVLNGNGTLTAKVDNGLISDGVYVVKGKTVIFTAAPNNNYEVKEWKLNDSVVTIGVTGNTYTLLDLNSDATVTVEFKSTSTGGNGGGASGGGSGNSGNKDDKPTTITDEKTPLGAVLSLASSAVASADMIPYYSEGGKDHFAPFSIYRDGTVYYLAEKGKTYNFKANPKEFNDTAGHWAISNINFTASREIFAGVAPQEFAPNATMTRGMFVTVLGRMASVDANGSTNSGFSDVSSSAWYASYVTWAAKNGIVTGANGKFNPDQTISRQDMAVMLDRFVKHMEFSLNKTESAAAFSDDAAINDYAKTAVKNMQGAGLLTGRNTGEFDPMGQASRAEVSAMLSRLIEKAMDSMIAAEKEKN